MNAIEISAHPRILITRLSHIGDCILTLPVAVAVRQAFPEAWIAWAIESPGDRLIRQCPAVDQVLQIPKGWMKQPRQAWSLRRLLRSSNFDVVIDPQSLTKSAALGWLSGARQRVGLARPLGRELAPLLNNFHVPVSQPHVVDRSLEMLEALGIDEPRVDFGLTLPDTARQTAARIIGDLNIEQPPVVINPGAGWKSRQWDNQRFGQVAAYLQQEHGLTPLVTWFGGEEETMADEIVSHSGNRAIKAPSTGLWDLAGLMIHSRFYIGCDTGPTHLAAAFRCPCITLFGTTEPQVSGPYELDPQRPIHLRLQSYYQAGSSRERRKAANRAMMDISVDKVRSAIDTMVGRTAGRVAA